MKTSIIVIGLALLGTIGCNGITSPAERTAPPVTVHGRPERIGGQFAPVCCGFGVEDRWWREEPPTTVAAGVEPWWWRDGP